jgi:hypothetical protein
MEDENSTNSLPDGAGRVVSMIPRRVVRYDKSRPEHPFALGGMGDLWSLRLGIRVCCAELLLGTRRNGGS